MVVNGSHRPRIPLLSIAIIVALVLVPLLTVALVPFQAAASSHREAPLIGEDPAADGTDVYAFTSPDRPDTVTLIYNTWPFQAPAGGPNFYSFGDDVLYRINVDNNGDAQADIFFDFLFKTQTVNPNTFLYNVGPISYNAANKTYTNWNVPQTYDFFVSKNGVPQTLGTNLLTPPNNLGPASTPNYASLVAPAINTNLAGTGIASFAGQRDDAFYVDLGRVFDLVSVNPAGGTDFLAGYGVNTIAIQVPKTYLQGANPNDNVIGVWATSSRQQTRVLNGNGNQNQFGSYIQVSRLGMPLVNEVVIGLQDKDRFNGTVVAPGSDLPYLPRVTDPELATLFVALGIDPNTPKTNRNDLVTVFLTGVPGINKPATASPAEMLRLNMSTPPSTNDPNTVNRMGVLGGQLDGFPNGRRLADDVTDIELQAVAGILCQTGGALAGNNPCRTTPVNTGLGDGVNANDLPFLTTFPYVAAPRPPYGPGSTPPTVPSYFVTITTGGSGTGAVTPGSGIYGGIASFTAVPAANNIFTGWTVDGTFVGIGNPIKLSMSRNRTLRADFAPRTGFTDVPSNDPAAEAIAQMKARGFINGTSPTTYEPNATVKRSQAAALIGRTFGFVPVPIDANPFPDRCDAQGQNCIGGASGNDDDLWGYVGSLAGNNIAQGWNDAPTCKAAGTTAPCYLPRDPVARIQLISFISRAMVSKGYWVKATTDTGVYANVPASTGARLDLVTFVNNAGDLPGMPSAGAFTDYEKEGSRGFAAMVIFQAYNAYFSVNRIPVP